MIALLGLILGGFVAAMWDHFPPNGFSTTGNKITVAFWFLGTFINVFWDIE